MRARLHICIFFCTFAAANVRKIQKILIINI